MAAPPAADAAEVDEADDLFGNQDRDEAEPVSALHADTGGSREELARGTATGPRVSDSDPNSLSHRLCSVDLCEVFSPPRVGQEAVKFGIKAGDAMDLTTGWDFNIPEHRRQAEEYVDKEKPLVLIGSPPCVAFSQLQTLIPDSPRKAHQLAEGIRHMEFPRSSWLNYTGSKSKADECLYMRTLPMPSHGRSLASRK